LDNHAHFLFRSDEAGISRVMTRLLTGYVLRKFGKTVRKGRSEYLVFVQAGVSEGRKPELVGGGLIRSLGGWKEVKKLRLDRQDRMKGDERILGDGDFVMEVLATANEGYERRYRLKSLGYDISRVERKVIRLFNIKKADLYSHSRKKRISEARSLFCYWCVRALGERMTDMAKLLGLTQPAIGYAVERGELLAKKEKHNLLD
jgi:putative transposase